MADFSLRPEGYRYRSLRFSDPPQSGWDVYALQSALDLEQDGIFGKRTGHAVRDFQEGHRLVVDGIAGGLTQRALAMIFVVIWQRRNDLPERLLMGQVEHESSFLVGNQSPTRTAGDADCGIAQRNSEHTPPAEGFDVPASIKALAGQISQKFQLYRDQQTERRAWELAAGSWNAPAWTDTLARGGTLSAAQSAHIEGYIDHVTAYVRWN